MQDEDDHIPDDPAHARALSLLSQFGLAAGPIILVIFLSFPAPPGLSPAGWNVAAVGMLMATWWITEAIPIPATALLPLVLFPVLGVGSVTDVAAPYANPLIFLFLGGFMIAIGMQRWELHRRVALRVIKAVGVRRRSVIVGFMASAAFLSMWVSNTATAVMMLPIALSVIELSRANADRPGKSTHFATALVLCIAYSCSIGGLGTLIGTPPNALLAGFMMETYGMQIGFAEWMLAGIPLVFIGLPIAYFILTRLVYPVGTGDLPGGQELLDNELEKLGPMSRAEKMVGAVFLLTAVLWVIRPLLEGALPGLSDASIAVFGALLLFLLPVRLSEGEFLLNWESAKKLPWDVLILFGGGLSLAAAIDQTGLAAWIGGGLDVIHAWPLVLVTLLLTVVVVVLTELTSNTATAAAFLPIVASAAIGIGENPLLFAVPVALAASCAFMLPVATPPNAIVYGSGAVSIPQMARSGIILNVLFTLLITAATYTLILWVFGVEIGQLPVWAGV